MAAHMHYDELSSPGPPLRRIRSSVGLSTPNGGGGGSNNSSSSSRNSQPRSAVIKTRKRTPAKFFKSPIRNRLAAENFCSVAKVQLADAMERRYKINGFWDWATVGLYLALGLLGLQRDLRRLLTLVSNTHNDSGDSHSGRGNAGSAVASPDDVTSVLSAVLVAFVWLVSFVASLVYLVQESLPARPPARPLAPRTTAARPLPATGGLGWWWRFSRCWRWSWHVAQQAASVVASASQALVDPALYCATAVAWVAVGFALYVTKLWMVGPVLRWWLDWGPATVGLRWDDTRLLAAASSDRIVMEADTPQQQQSRNTKKGSEEKGFGTKKRGAAGRSTMVDAPRRLRMSRSRSLLDTFFNVTPRVDLLFDVRSLPSAGVSLCLYV
jgi:hypothetical protein